MDRKLTRRFLPLFLLVALAHGQIVQQIVGISAPTSLPTGTPTLVQGPIHSVCSTTTCAMTLTTDLVAGNFYGIMGFSNDGAAAPVAIISSSSPSIGTIINEPGCTGATSSVNWFPFCAYVMPLTSLGTASTSLTFTISVASGGTGTELSLWEIHPSAAGSNIALDNAGAIQYTSATSSQNGPAFTTSGTNDFCFVGWQPGNAYNSFSSVSSPYSTSKYVQGSNSYWAVSEAISTSTPTWTPNTNSNGWVDGMCFGWNPTAPVELSYNSLGNVVNGSGVTAAELNGTQLGQNGGTWLTTVGSLITGDSTHFQGLLNATGRTAGDGISYGPGGVSLGLVYTANGSPTSADVVYAYTFSALTSASFAIPFCSDLVASDTTNIDLLQIGSTGSGYSNIIWAGTGTTREFKLETETGNGASPILYAAGNSCANGGSGWVWLMLQYNTTGTGCSGHPCNSLAVFNSSGVQIGTTQTAEEIAAFVPSHFIIGNAAAEAMTNGKHDYFGVPYWSLSGTFPLAQ